MRGSIPCGPTLRGSTPGTRLTSSARESARFQIFACGPPTGYWLLKLAERWAGRRSIFLIGLTMAVAGGSSSMAWVVGFLMFPDLAGTISLIGLVMRLLQSFKHSERNLSFHPAHESTNLRRECFGRP